MTEMEKKIRLVTGEGSWHTYGGKKMKRALLSDGPHGLRKQEEGEKENNKSVRATCFPAACALAASWDVSLADALARALSKEAIAEDVAVVLGPGVNIKRSPLCGRNFEYYSEDPYLAGCMAASYIAAMQQEGVGCSLKHFAANSQETFRMTANSRIDERTLREIYLTAFEIAIKKSQPATIMASYNQINGVYSCENKWLLSDVLRGEWGYEGLVVSDWGACSRLPESIRAGLDLEMPDASLSHTPKLKKALINGEVCAEDINRAAGNVARLVSKYVRPDSKASIKDKSDILSENHKIAVDIASKCAVLLKNDGLLPLRFENDARKRVLVIGSMAKNVRFQGGGSSHINTENVPDMLEALKKHGITCLYKAGYDDTKDVKDETLFNAAVASAKRAADKNIPVIFCGGLPDYAEGEGFDRTSLCIPDNQSELLKAICDINPNTVFLSFAGSPFDISPADKAASQLLMYLGGEGVCEAAARLILGIDNPCGKLAETFPLQIEDTPCYGNFATKSRNCDYKERFYVGYRYYDSKKVPVKYPFGHGLSYTEYEYSNMRLTSAGDIDAADADMTGREIKTMEISDGDDLEEVLTVSLTVKNTGNYPGREIVQIYAVNPKTDGIERAERELRGFKVVSLNPGESREISLPISRRAFLIYDVKAQRYRAVPGCYTLQAAASVADVRCEASLEIINKPNRSIKDADSAAGIADAGAAEDSYNGFADALPYGPAIDFDMIKDTLGDLDNILPGDFTLQNSLTQLSEYSLLGRAMLNMAIRIGYSMFKGKPKDDPEVMMCIEGIKEGTIDCVFNNAQGVIPYGIAELIVMSANRNRNNNEEIKAEK